MCAAAFSGEQAALRSCKREGIGWVRGGGERGSASDLEEAFAQLF